MQLCLDLAASYFAFGDLSRALEHLTVVSGERGRGGEKREMAAFVDSANADSVRVRVLRAGPRCAQWLLRRVQVMQVFEL